MSQELHQRLQAVWGNRPGWGQLSAVNHSSLGRRFIVTGLVFFVIGGLLAMLIRTQLAFPENNFVDPDTYNRLFTLHGTTMMFLFAVPILEAFAVYLIPKMIGTRDMVFPRLSAYGYWCYLFGGLLLYSGLLVNAVPAEGWFMYPPLSGPLITPDKGPDFWLLGITLAEVSAIVASVELVASILITRAPGMTLAKMPIFAWYMLVVALMILLAFPPLILGSLLLEAERAFGLPFYDAARGGDPLLWQHLFWLFGHPEVYIIFLPAAGLISTMIPVHAQRPLASYTWLVVAVITTGFISFGLWVHHMYTVGIPQLALGFFSAASMAVAIPTGIQIFTWIATLWPVRPRLTVPMLYILGFFFIFVLGGLTGVMVALAPFDWQVHDTHFVVAHMHYVLVGGMVFPLFAALYHWLPHLSGRMPSARLGRVGFWLNFIGFNLTFLVMHMTGMQGMPRRVHTYPEQLGLEWLNLISSVGGFIMSAGVAAVLLDLLLYGRHGRKAPPNPWRAATLEWATPMPAPAYNFASIPEIRQRDPLWEDPDLGRSIARGEHYLGGLEIHQREILGTDPISARPTQVIVVPGNTWKPLVLAVFTALVMVGVLVGWYWLSVLAFAAVLAAAAGWALGRGGVAPTLRAGPTLELPSHIAHPRPPGWWGTAIALLSSATVAASLLFAYFYYWTAAPRWPPPVSVALPLVPALASLLLLGLSSLTLVLASRGRGARAWVALGAVLALAAAALMALMLPSAAQATAHASAAIHTAVLAWLLLHQVIMLVMAAVLLLRLNRPDAGPRGMLATVGLFWHYSVVQALALLPPLLFFPLAGAG